MIRRIYESLLQSRIDKSSLPGCVAVVLGSADLSGKGLSRLCQLLDWSRSIGLSSLILYVSDEQPDLCRTLNDFLATYPAQINLHTAEGVVRTGAGGALKVNISLGYGGKREVVEAFRSILQGVEEGNIDGDKIDEKTI